MRRPFIRGIWFLGVFLGFSCEATRAQEARNPTGSGLPPATRLRGVLGASPSPRLARADQGPAPELPPPNPDSTPGSAVPARSEPTSPNPAEIELPSAERAGGGGEPTEAELAAEEAEAPERNKTQWLMELLGIEESPVKVYGWIQNSFTGNTLGTPKNNNNFGVNPNFLANRWMGNQYYLIIENPLEQNDRINLGFRVDNLFGNDWQFNHMRGLFETSFRPNHFAGYDPAQIYGEIHLPFLTRGGIDVKGGRFYTILGYEVVPATGRPLLSVPYMFNYGQPFTHFGVISTLHLTDRVNVLNGTVNGWDRWINENYKWNYLGGITWTSKSGKASLAVSYIFGPNQYPRFLNAGNPFVLPGNTPPPFEAGRRNPNYGSDSRLLFTTVLTYKWNDQVTQVIETDQGFESNIPGTGPGGTNLNNSWYSFGNWFFYTFGERLTGVWRAEVFRDNGGQRTGFSDNFYEQTLGLIYKPKPYIWVRPEARYDWSQFTHPYFDGTKKSQFTLAVDVILLF